jgi:hypothetical protein
MSNELDLNIENYTVDELINILRIETPVTKNGINSKLQHIIDKYSISGNGGNVNEYVIFFENARNKLLNAPRFTNVTDTIVVGTTNTNAPPLLPYTYQNSAPKATEFNKLHNDTVDDLLQNIDTTTITKNGPRNVIKHPNLDTVPTYNQEHVAGALNPIKRRIVKKSLLVDTRFRPKLKTDKKHKHKPKDKSKDKPKDDPKDKAEDESCIDKSTNTNFSIQLPNTINNVISMKLTSFEFPKSFYIFSEKLKTNVMTIILDGSSHIIKIPSGNYTPEGLVNCMNATLLSPLVPDISANYDNINGKFGFSVASGTTLELDFRIPSDKTRDINLNMGWIFGFRKPVYTGKISYTSEGIFDLIGVPYVYLMVDDFQNNVENNFIGAFEESIKKSYILARIPQSELLDIPLGSNIFSKPSELILKKRTYFGPVSIDRLKIQVLDQYHRVIDINNMDWSMSIELECVYNL